MEQITGDDQEHLFHFLELKTEKNKQKQSYTDNKVSQPSDTGEQEAAS